MDTQERRKRMALLVLMIDASWSRHPGNPRVEEQEFYDMLDSADLTAEELEHEREEQGVPAPQGVIQRRIKTKAR